MFDFFLHFPGKILIHEKLKFVRIFSDYLELYSAIEKVCESNGHILLVIMMYLTIESCHRNLGNRAYGDPM